LTVDLSIDPTAEITGQPVSRTQASDASGRLPRYEAKCVELTYLLSRYNAEPLMCEMSVENVIRQNSQRHT